MQHDDGGEAGHEEEVKRPGERPADEIRRQLDGEECRRRQQGDREREEHDLARRRAADGEEGGVPAEDVEERLREGEG